MIIPTVREAARQRMDLDGVDAQALEHALTITERERDAALAENARLKEMERKAGDVEGMAKILYADYPLFAFPYSHEKAKWEGLTDADKRPYLRRATVISAHLSGKEKP
jgi:hypothetical protein